MWCTAGYPLFLVVPGEDGDDQLSEQMAHGTIVERETTFPGSGDRRLEDLHQRCVKHSGTVVSESRVRVCRRSDDLRAMVKVLG